VLCLYFCVLAAYNEWVFHSEELDWFNAEAACNAEGGHLASVHTAERDQALFDFVQAQAPGTVAVWLGGHDLNAEVRPVVC